MAVGDGDARVRVFRFAREVAGWEGPETEAPLVYACLWTIEWLTSLGGRESFPRAISALTTAVAHREPAFGRRALAGLAHLHHPCLDALKDACAE